MLYEVITGEALRVKNSSDFTYLNKAISSYSADIRNNIIFAVENRITSYNVCYTKLLRELVVLVLGLGDVFVDLRDVADLGEHVEHCLIGAPVSRSPQRGDAGRDAGVRVGTRTAGEAYGRGARILLVVGVQDEQHVNGAFGA